MIDWASRFREPAWPHQTEEFRAHRDARARALHWQPRTGKSKAMVDLACYLYSTGKIDAVLVLAPMNVHANWQRNQIFRHSWEGVDSRAFTWSSTARREDPDGYDRAFGGLLAHEGLAWFAVNAEATTMAVARPFLSAFVRRRRILLIVDETHDWRRPSSKRSVYARNLARRVAYVRNLSGTMIDNSPFHAWAQYELLAPGALGFSDYGDFERHFGVWEKRQIKVKGGRTRLLPTCTDYRNQEELRERMAAWTSYVHRSDVPGLPDLVNSRTEFELTAAQRRVYNDLVKGAIVRLDNGEYMGEAEGATLITRLQQVASGFAVDEDGNTVDLVADEANPRLQALEAELALVGHKTIVYCRYREDVAKVMAACRRWGYRPVDYFGGTPKGLRAEHERLFQEDEAVGPLVGNAKACGVGLEFSRGTDIIWYSHTHGDLIGRKQGDERCTKVGGASVGVCDFAALGTVDEKMLSDQEGKVEVADYLTGEGLRRWLAVVP